MIIARIQLLNPLLSNQIAAGEVIERPASVVKELLENSVDAGATHIKIDLEKSGKQLIRITDNGSGIYPDDLPLAVSRHATSKISSLDDLTNIQSLGFRGEALASIISVSRLRLISATTDEHAQQLVVEGEDLHLKLSPAVHMRGTTVEVRELFFNTPVRRQFLRSDKTELLTVLDIIHKIALSRPALGITVTHNKKCILQLSSTHDLAEQIGRISKICGKNFIQQSHYISEEAQSLELHGWITRSGASYPYANTQYFFLNGRIVRDKVINHALRVAAQDFLPTGRYLAYVLYFSCNPLLTDINVHPTKHEVRFQSPRLIHDFIVHVLRRAWQQTGIQEAAIMYADNAITLDISPQTVKLITTPVASESYIATPDVAAIDAQDASQILVNKVHLPRIIELIHQRYLLLETNQGLNIIDCIAAKELIYTQQVQQARSSSMASKPLLWPVSVNLTSAQMHALQTQVIDWQALGIDWQASGKQQIIVRRLPTILANVDPTALFIALSTTDKLIATMVQFAARAQIPILPEQRQQLLLELQHFSALDFNKVVQVINLTR